MGEATIHIDGGSRGNPGPAAYALVLRRPGFAEYTECDTIGVKTNNVAEYAGLLRALALAIELKLESVLVISDSELLVRQMLGEYKVKSSDLLGPYRAAKELAARLPRLGFKHVKREFNRDADALCNEALDGRPRPPAGLSEAPLDVPPEVPGDPMTAAILTKLATAAHQWAANGPADPPVARVWAELAAVLAEYDYPFGRGGAD